MTANIPVITIDGPGGAGKGTLCKAMAEALGWHLLDSGAIYRGSGAGGAASSCRRGVRRGAGAPGCPS